MKTAKHDNHERGRRIAAVSPGAGARDAGRRHHDCCRADARLRHRTAPTKRGCARSRPKWRALAAQGLFRRGDARFSNLRSRAGYSKPPTSGQVMG